VAGALIAVAVVEATIRTVPIAVSSFWAANTSWSHEAKEDVRLRLGRWLVLEFELGAVILRTAIAPTWSEIGQKAAVRRGAAPPGAGP